MKKIAVFSFIIAAAIIAIAIFAFFLFSQRDSMLPFSAINEMKVGEREIGVLFLGDSAFVLKTSRHVVIVDPSSKILRDAAKSLGKIDAVLITHEHSDHFASEATLDLYRESGCVIIVNEGAYGNLRTLLEQKSLVLMKPGENVSINGILIESVDANHSAVSPLMYVITMDGLTMLHASDSGFTYSLGKFAEKIDLAILPIGSPSPTASPSEALKMAKAVLPKKIVMMHGSSSEYSEFRNLLANSGLNITIEEVEAHKPRKISF
ncbi:MBL fold metallo-hydrolase [Candidatus Bathyarchaeota archaeon]|nr:MBL fold metallo-hydrolase [Candidatus Bathyarchaeota archaeon]